MHIQINLFASLKKFMPHSADNYSIADNTTVAELINKLKVPAEEAKIVFINRIKKDFDSILKDGDRVGIFPPVGGG